MRPRINGFYFNKEDRRVLTSSGINIIDDDLWLVHLDELEMIDDETVSIREVITSTKECELETSRGSDEYRGYFMQ